MLRLAILILLPLLSIGLGAAAGIFLSGGERPEDASMDMESELKARAAREAISSDAHQAVADELIEYVRLQNQYIVPVLSQGRVEARVVMGLSVGVATGRRTEVFEIEPRLRDAFLQELFSHANTGGFNGNFTSTRNLVLLRSALEEAARSVAGDLVKGVFISEMGRQDA